VDAFGTASLGAYTLQNWSGSKVRNNTQFGAGAGANAPCPMISAGGASLQIQMGKPSKVATLTLHALDANDQSVATKSIRLASSPLFLGHHLDDAEKLWVVAKQKYLVSNHVLSPGNNAQMVGALKGALGGLLTVFDGEVLPAFSDDLWIQDHLELGNLAGDRPNDRTVFVMSSIRTPSPMPIVDAPNFRVEGFTAPSDDWGVNSFGNLETSPPVTVAGKAYPFGRVYSGTHGSSKRLNASLRTLLDDQLQAPFEIDTSWLTVGHVDEILTFIPDPSSPKGFKMLFDDTQLFYDLADKMDPAMKLPMYSPYWKQQYGSAPPVAYPTVGDLLADTALRAKNADKQLMYLDPIREQMKQELGLAESDIIRIPAIFRGGHTLMPDLVNLLLVNLPGQKPVLFLPDPFFRAEVGKAFNFGTQQPPAGYDPLDLGDQSKDPIIEYVKSKLPAGVEARFVDDWLYHLLWGEVHCGTNTLRKPPESWWEKAQLPPLTDAPWTCGCQPQTYSTPPAFVGTATPVSGGKIDWVALDQELVTYRDLQNLQLTVKVPYDPGNGCGSITFELPTPCGPSDYTDYKVWRMGGAAGIVIFPPQIPQYFNDWAYNPGFIAEGMMDVSYTHPAKSVVVTCQGQGVGFCSIGSYGPGTDDTALIPSDLARLDTSYGPMQPGMGAYDGHIRAFPVHQRTAPDASLPQGYQLCYDTIDLHAQGGGALGTCQNDGLEHGSIYLTFQAREKVCATP